MNHKDLLTVLNLLHADNSTKSYIALAKELNKLSADDKKKISVEIIKAGYTNKPKKHIH